VLDLLTAKGIPWVALGIKVIAAGELSGGSGFYFDDIDGAYELTRYLPALGHRQIDSIGKLRLPCYSRCYQGYAGAMHEAGVKIQVNERTFSEGEDMGYVATKLILQQVHAPTAIFAGDDTAGRGVYQAAREIVVSEFPRTSAWRGSTILPSLPHGTRH
jgi:DNA-binding LacI/PurR family transcriptional regulator